ncbi:BRCT domain-containing protein [Ramlibacter humi]|uniref:NAD-dependent DNA ligase n=1 Tax=Ramlibacter humi TaxID=2530451 RepID=A0A4Z0CD30_9BURK|nr:BRCT domain-containing protein [Ramlibacter humi]TFZ08185.1 NAD-dependent DNA ligase [Ramlibacter humi]
MPNLYTRQAAAFRNEMRQSCAALVGIVQGLLADGQLNDQEIQFLNKWLTAADAVNGVWPGSAIHAKVNEILADGHVTAEERSHLVEVLEGFVGGKFDDVDARPVNALAFDEILSLDFADQVFCMTGDFAFGPRTVCESAVLRRGGSIAASVTKKLNFLIVGGLGSAEWKHGNFGTKIEKAIEYRTAGVPLRIVHEDIWASSMSEPA